MTTMISEVYEALRSAGVADDKARTAAEALARSDEQFQTLRGAMHAGFADLHSETVALRGDMQTGLAGLRAELGADFARIDRRLSVVTWPINAVIAVIVLIGAPMVWLVIRLAAKAGML